MPCHDDRDDSDREDSQKRLDITTRLACMYCKSNPVPDWAADWWHNHQLYDQLAMDREAHFKLYPKNSADPSRPMGYSVEFEEWRDQNIALNSAYRSKKRKGVGPIVW